MNSQPPELNQPSQCDDSDGSLSDSSAERKRRRNTKGHKALERFRSAVRRVKQMVSRTENVGTHAGSQGCTTAASATPNTPAVSKSASVETCVASTVVEEVHFPNRPVICRIPVRKHADLGLSFSGCGFLGTYHFGVATCFLKNGQPLLSRLRRVGGASAGSLVSALLVLAPQDVPKGLNTLYNLADELNSLKFGALSPGFYLNERLLKVVEEYIPDDISVAQQRLFISVTNHKTRENKLVSEFTSREHLIKCLMSSCYIPLYSMGMTASPPEIDGTGYVDGGYSNNVPDFEDLRTITVSPFSGSVDISPCDPVQLFDWKMTLGNQQMKVNLRNIVRGAQALFPPSRTALHQYYTMGYKDAFKFLLENELLQRQAGTPV